MHAPQAAPPREAYAPFLDDGQRGALRLRDAEHPDALGWPAENDADAWRPVPADADLDTDFWRAVGELVGSERLAHLWLRIFARTVGLRHASPTQRLSFKVELNMDEGGYALGPHTDSPSKYVTALYYLPPTGEEVPGAGTAVVRSKKGRTQKGKSEWRSWADKDWVVEHTAAFAANRAFAFAPCASSWHAVRKQPLEGEGYRRDSIQSFVVASGGAPKKAECPRR